MDTVQNQSVPTNAGAIMPAMQTAFENWTAMNTRLTQMFLDASVAQVNGLQELMRPPVAAQNDGSPQPVWEAQVDQMKRQMEESISFSRRIADEARRTLFELATTMLQAPLAAQAQLTQTLGGNAAVNGTANGKKN